MNNIAAERRLGWIERAMRYCTPHLKFGRMLIVAVAAALLPSCSKTANKPIDVSRPAPVSKTFAGHLQDGTEYRAAAVIGDSATSRSLTATIGKRAVEFPTGTFDGLPPWSEALVVQFAESAGDVLLMLADGRLSGEMWNCSFRIRALRVVERELTTPGVHESKVDRYYPPLISGFGAIPMDEIVKARAEDLKRTEAAAQSQTK